MFKKARPLKVGDRVSIHTGGPQGIITAIIGNTTLVKPLPRFEKAFSKEYLASDDPLEGYPFSSHVLELVEETPKILSPYYVGKFSKAVF